MTMVPAGTDPTLRVARTEATTAAAVTSAILTPSMRIASSAMALGSKVRSKSQHDLLEAGALASFGPRLKAYVLRAAAGSGRRDELVKAGVEAQRTVAWLESTHAGWLQAEASGIADAAVRRDLREEHLAKLGASYVAGARCGVVAYEKFVAAHAGL